MPNQVPDYDSSSDPYEGEDFARVSALAALDEIDCEEADLLRALAIEDEGLGDVVGVVEYVDIGSLSILSHRAMSVKREPAHEPVFFFPPFCYYTLYDANAGAGTAISKRKVVRVFVHYFDLNNPPHEFVKIRSDDELKRGALHLSKDIEFTYVLAAKPFFNG